MKVTKIKSFSVAAEDGRGYFIVKVETDAGIHGLGEVGILFWGAAIKKAIEHLSEIVVGQGCEVRRFLSPRLCILNLTLAPAT